MLFASLLGIFLIPMLYVVFQWLRERVGRAPRPEQGRLAAEPPPASGGAPAD
jgi:HAE1 family hydrophobic/amphiphilic exporter-1